MSLLMSSFLKIKYYKLKGLVSLKINSTIFKKIVPHKPFLPTANALINYKNEVMNLSFSNMILELNTFNIYKQARDQEDEVVRIRILSSLNQSLMIIFKMGILQTL